MKRTIVTALAVVFGTSALFAQQLSDKLSLKNAPKEISYSSYGYTRSDLRNNVFDFQKPSEIDLVKAKQNVQQEPVKEKSVLLGTVLSALVPGAGEFYAKSYLKAGIFFGVELLSWGTYALFQVKGDNQTDKFQKYADQYWSVHTYAQWLVDQGFEGAGVINPNEPNREVLRQQIIQCEAQNFSHTLPEFGSQQFYELIGKYQNFQAGWTNLSHIPTKAPGPYWFEKYKDPVFLSYADERQKANDYYNYAKDGVMVVVLNHILSAGDAAWTVSMFNKKIKMETGFEIKRYRSPFTGEAGNLPSFDMKVTF
jgi:hypothetical protein